MEHIEGSPATGEPSEGPYPGTRPENDDGSENVPEEAAHADVAAAVLAQIEPPEEELPDIGEASAFALEPAVPETEDEGGGGIGGAPARTRIMDTTIYPYRAIASLRITAADGSIFQGTGFFINRRTVVTAGHCVWINNSVVPARNGPVRSIEVIPGRNGTLRPFDSAVATTFHARPEWTENASKNHDYGVIILNAPLAQDVGAFGFGVYTDAELMAATANIAGYPVADLPPGEPTGTQWFHSRKVISPMLHKVFYDTDTSKGQSGAPVWRIINRRRFAFAIHIFGGRTLNSGTRITAAVHAQLLEWMV